LYELATGWIQDLIDSGVDSALSLGNTCCPLNGVWRKVHNAYCTTEMRVCLKVPSGRVKGSSSGVSAEIGFELVVELTASCSSSFTIEKADSYPIYQDSIAGVEAMAAFEATIIGGMYGKLTLTFPGSLKATSSGAPSGTMDAPSVVADAGVSVTVSAKAWVGVEATALYMASVAAKAVAETNGAIAICNGGAQAGGTYTRYIEGSYSLSAPDISVPAGFCGETISVDLGFTGLGNARTVSLNAGHVTAGYGGTCPTDCACTETCNYASDGDCDDGGSGQEYSICAKGSDCTDCGTRCR